MDLSCFATKELADEGVVFPVKIDGTKVPLALKIYGSDSDVVKDYDLARVRKFGLLKDKKELDDDATEELIESQNEAAVIRIGGLWAYDWKKKTTTDEPVELFGRKLGCDKASYEYLCEKMPAIKEFVFEKSNERNNFLSLGKKN